MEKNSLMVIEALTRDVGRAVARMDYAAMTDMGLSTGDIIEIKGKRTTVAKFLPELTAQQLEAEQKQLVMAREKLSEARHEHSHETRSDRKDKRNLIETKSFPPGKTVRIDGLIRNNAGIAIGENVAIRRVDVPPAERVAVVPLQTIPPVDERYLADALEGFPLMRGNNIMVPYFGGRLTFQVIKVEPKDIGIVTQQTVFSLTSQGITLRDSNGFKYYSDGKKITFLFDFAVKKEGMNDDYLVLKMSLYHGGFETGGEFQIRLENTTSIQHLVSRYKENGRKIVEDANNKLGLDDVDSSNLINSIKFEILEKWRTV